MSLLMDALRKAEESKKKAESKASAQPQQPVDRFAEPPPDRAAAGASKPAETPDSAQQTEQPRDSESASVAGQPSTPDRAKPAATTPEPADSNAAAPASTPEPATPTPQAADDPPDPAGSKPESTASKASSRSANQSIPDLPLEFDSPTPVVPEESGQVARPSAAPASDFELAPKEGTHPRQHMALGDAPAPIPQESDKGAPVSSTKEQKPEAGEAPEPTLPPELETPKPRTVQSKSGQTDTIGKQPEAESPAMRGPTGMTPAASSKVRERSAGHRASARSVFAAKKPQQHVRRQRMLMAGGGLVIVLLLGGGLVFYLNSGSDSGITLPENYVANQDFSSRGNDVGQDTFGIDNNDSVAVQESEQPVDNSLSSNQDSGLDDPLDQPGLAVSSTAAVVPMPATPADVAQPELVSDGLAVGVAARATAPESAVAPAGSAPASPAATPVEQAIATVEGLQNAAASAAANAVGQQQPAPAASQQGLDTTPPQAALVEPASTAEISFSRRPTESIIEPQLNQAYTAFQQGSYSQARQFYESVLADAPLHRDALLGLAAIAVENQQPGQAMEYYSRLLARNPADPVARAALLELQPAGGPAAQERELRRLQQAHPGVAPLAYALGNFYASRQQWTDAQQNYFRALQLAKTTASRPSEVNPDYAFNLAVSLEHLGQSRAAVSFYREALEQANGFPASFDAALVRNRIESISRTMTP